MVLGEREQIFKKFQQWGIWVVEEANLVMMKCETTCRVGVKVLMRSCRSESIQLCGSAAG